MYSNFVRQSSPSQARVYSSLYLNINGDDAKKLYLEEVKIVGDPEPATLEDKLENSNVTRKRRLQDDDNRTLTDNDLFVSVQVDDIDTLKFILDRSPDKINVLDDYGWSLLMIACQANSIQAVRELLTRDVNTSIRDKAGNSAQNLVIKNKNLILADLLLTHNKKKNGHDKTKQNHMESKRVKLKEKFTCDICFKTYPDKQEHLCSTIHNINASKGKKIPANYIIPPSNKGYQLMLKEGWDRESGLGPNGSGKRYPIKTVQKRDRKGLGLDRKKVKVIEMEKVEKQTKEARERQHRYNQRLEAKFRREFY